MTVLVPSKDSANEQITNQCRELAALITRHTNAKGDGFHRTAIDRKDSGQGVLTSVTSEADYHNYGKRSASETRA